MKFLMQDDYALRITAYLVNRQTNEEDVIFYTRGEITKACGVPENFAMQLLASLSNSGVLISRRGKGGGFRIRNLNTVNAYDVIRAVDEDYIRKPESEGRLMHDIKAAVDDLLKNTPITGKGEYKEIKA